MNQTIVLGGGGDAEQSQLIDEMFSQRLTRRTVLYLPQAIAPHDWTFERAYDWFVGHRALSDLSVTTWEHLDGRTNEDLEPFDAIYLMGGNTFVLLSELRQSGLISLLPRFADSGGILYGISAGAIVLGVDISTAGVGPDPDENVVQLTDLRGANLIAGHNVHCHYNNDQKSEVASHAARGHIPILAIPETSGLLIDKGSAVVLGPDPLTVFSGSEQGTFGRGATFTLELSGAAKPTQPNS